MAGFPPDGRRSGRYRRPLWMCGIGIGIGTVGVSVHIVTHALVPLYTPLIAKRIEGAPRVGVGLAPAVRRQIRTRENLLDVAHRSYAGQSEVGTLWHPHDDL